MSRSGLRPDIPHGYAPVCIVANGNVLNEIGYVLRSGGAVRSGRRFSTAAAAVTVT